MKKRWITLVVAGLVMSATSVYGIDDTKSISRDKDWEVEELTAESVFNAISDDAQALNRLVKQLLKGSPKAFEGLGFSDMRIGEVQLGDTIKEGDVIGKKKGYFQDYVVGDDITYIVYEGPDSEKNDRLRLQGLVYPYANGQVVGIRLKGSELKTPRDVGISSYRGAVLYAYGPPQDIWRRLDEDELIFVYRTFTNEKNNGGRGEKYLLITMTESRVSQIDMLEKGILSTIGYPVPKERTFTPGRMIDEDFVLMGQELHKVFEPPKNLVWEVKGRLDEYPFIAYDGFLVAYDKRHAVQKVLLSKDSVTTPRGVGIGDSLFVLTQIYGTPDFIKRMGEESDEQVKGVQERKEVKKEAVKGEEEHKEKVKTKSGDVSEIEGVKTEDKASLPKSKEEELGASEGKEKPLVKEPEKPEVTKEEKDELPSLSELRKKAKKKTIYGYKHPKKENVYLLFNVLEEEGFISGVELSSTRE